MVVGTLACGQCGAGLAPPDASGSSACVYCGAKHHAERSSEVRPAARVDRPSWRDCEDAARIPLTEDAVLDLVRQHFADVDSILVCPHLPPADERAARHAHVDHLPPHERILALYETSSLGAAGHEGLLVTSRRLCWKNPGEPARSIEWRDVDPDRLYVDSYRLCLGDDVIVIAAPEVQDACADAFHVLALSGLPPEPGSWSHGALSGDLRAPTEPATPHGDAAHSGLLPRSNAERALGGGPLPLDDLELDDDVARRRDTTPPPPHTTSYFAYASHAQAQAPDCSCWRCYTPLYESTPECAFCGATPTRAGWLRTG
ncbi:MAG: hypothetical protein KF764_27215 [Labilithrix sp.]|nr:hypothetical protein [Labilithrix sp.]MBX3223269.1 hypothetical protein [Labilithrix sp.]